MNESSIRFDESSIRFNELQFRFTENRTDQRMPLEPDHGLRFLLDELPRENPLVTAATGAAK